MKDGAGSSKTHLEKELGVRVGCEAKQLGVLKLSELCDFRQAA